MTQNAVPTLRAIGAILRDEWPDRGLGPARQFDLAVMRLIESARDWRALSGTERLRASSRWPNNLETSK